MSDGCIMVRASFNVAVGIVRAIVEGKTHSSDVFVDLRPAQSGRA